MTGFIRRAFISVALVGTLCVPAQLAFAQVPTPPPTDLKSIPSTAGSPRGGVPTSPPSDDDRDTGSGAAKCPPGTTPDSSRAGLPGPLTCIRNADLEAVKEARRAAAAAEERAKAAEEAARKAKEQAAADAERMAKEQKEEIERLKKENEEKLKAAASKVSKFTKEQLAVIDELKGQGMSDKPTKLILRNTGSFEAKYTVISLQDPTALTNNLVEGTSKKNLNLERSVSGWGIGEEIVEVPPYAKQITVIARALLGPTLAPILILDFPGSSSGGEQCVTMTGDLIGGVDYHRRC